MTKNILIKNIYYMLSYAFQNLNQKEYEDISKEDFENIHNLFADILLRGISRQVKQGLYKTYVSKTEDLTCLRGKINISGSIKNKISSKKKLSCEYDEFSEDNIFNRILKSTVNLLINHPNLDRKYKAELKQLMLFFSDVSDLSLRTVKWNNLVFSRNNINYRMLISICQLIVEGMLISEQSGTYKLRKFVDEKRMCRLYEKFLLEYYKKEHKDLKTSSKQIKWALDDGVGTMLPIMQSDVMLEKNDKVLIIDAKYYSRTTQVNFDKHTVHSSNLYQIFTYVKNKELEIDNGGKVSGMLLYAQTEKGMKLDNAYEMSGNTIYVKTLDLNREFKDIRYELDKIVRDFFD